MRFPIVTYRSQHDGDVRLRLGVDQGEWLLLPDVVSIRQLLSNPSQQALHKPGVTG